MAHQNQFGLFSYNRTIYDGDPYGAVPTKKIGCDAKRMGKQFVTSPIKRGKTADVYFSPKMIESVMVGSKYTTLFDEDRKYQLEKKAKQLGKTFVPPHPSGKAEGKGSYYGAFSKWENIKSDDSYDKRPRTKDDAPVVPKNFLTSPPKRGFEGLLSCRGPKGLQGFVGEYHYEPSPPPPKKPQSAPVKPFKPANPMLKKKFWVGLGITYESEGAQAKEAKKEFFSTKAWNPARINPIKGPAGRVYSCINPPPVYQPEGVSRDDKVKHVADTSKMKGGPFRPASSSKSMRSCSIVNMRRNVASAGSY